MNTLLMLLNMRQICDELITEHQQHSSAACLQIVLEHEFAYIV